MSEIPTVHGTVRTCESGSHRLTSDSAPTPMEGLASSGASACRAGPACAGRGALSAVATVTIVGLFAHAALAPVHAQQFPGLVLSQPTPMPQAAPPPPAPAKVKPKPKPKAAIETASTATETSSKGTGERIVMLVNDEAVTAREIEQRTRFLGASSNVGQKAQEIFKNLASSEATNKRFRAMAEEIIKQNQNKPKEQIMALIEQRKQELGASLQRQAMEQAKGAEMPKFRKDAIEEIIEEKLKLQEAKKEGIEVNDDEANRIIKSIADRNKQTEAQFNQGLKSSGVDIATMRNRFKAAFAWREVIRRKYGAQVQVNDKEIERAIAALPAGKGQTDTQELQVQRIVFSLPGKLDQGAMARALADADGVRRKYSGCKAMETLVKDQASAKYEPAKFVKPSTIVEPARSMMLGAKDGEMLPPQTAADGVELVAVCSRRALQIDDQQKMQATQELQSKKFEELANRRLRELRQDAQIEQRG